MTDFFFFFKVNDTVCGVMVGASYKNKAGVGE